MHRKAKEQEGLGAMAKDALHVTKVNKLIEAIILIAL